MVYTAHIVDVPGGVKKLKFKWVEVIEYTVRVVDVHALCGCKYAVYTTEKVGDTQRGCVKEQLGTPRTSWTCMDALSTREGLMSRWSGSGKDKLPLLTEYTVHTPPGTSTTCGCVPPYLDVHCALDHLDKFMDVDVSGVIVYTMHVMDVHRCVEVIEYTKVIKYTVHIKIHGLHEFVQVIQYTVHIKGTPHTSWTCTNV
ncbi:hypothetical protein BDP27DRAFT_1364587 [Rhodocollybia butyracea]|uniref:Uncharacterized protein n=1 Tax=Rhodocollybia butyracea TaxID=206335 RepID=A0A9P5PTN2_9AGAR|nr:hypothetical protein BDP27DRAFT_1364587 [Rhodocollybia butyracea]